jgi:hypothetical protein
MSTARRHLAGGTEGNTDRDILKDVHAQLVLGPEERAALGNLADNLRSSEPVSPSSFTSVDKAIARL